MEKKRTQQNAPMDDELYALGARASDDDKQNKKPLGSKRDSAIEHDNNSKRVKRAVCGVVRKRNLLALCTAYDAGAAANEEFNEHVCATLAQMRDSKNADSLKAIALAYQMKVQPGRFEESRLCSEFLDALLRNNARPQRLPSVCYGLTANLLLKLYADRRDWPDWLLRAYVEDAINERFWADNPYCSELVSNICAAFQTRRPNNLLMQLEPREAVGDLHSRFSCGLVQRVVAEALKTQSKRHQIESHTKHLLKFLATAAGMSEVRHFATARLELWLNHTKLGWPAQTLLAYICTNVQPTIAMDNEFICTLLKMRLKHKPIVSHYLQCFKILLEHSCILPWVLKFVVLNELSNARNPNNMGLLSVMCQSAPARAAEQLAFTFREQLTQREDSLRSLRSFLRELVRMLHWQFDFVFFCKALLRDPAAPFNAILDIVCLTMFLAISPQVRDAYVSAQHSSAVLMRCYEDIMQIQHAGIMRLLRTPMVNHKRALQKLLLLDAHEQYVCLDQWPNEVERSLLHEILSQTPLHEQSLLSLLLMALQPDKLIDITDVFEVLINGLQRVNNMAAITVDKYEIIDLIFGMIEYHFPLEVELPAELVEPKIALSRLYWQAWLLLMLIAAHNMSTFGSYCWSHFPTMRALIELCITQQHDDVFNEQEQQLLAAERAHLLAIGRCLQSQLTTETETETAHIDTLTSELLIIDPRGPCRQLPPSISIQLAGMKLGDLFCRCRNPNLLLEIIQRHRSTKPRPWLVELVARSNGDFSQLPVQCLCEFLLTQNDEKQNARTDALLSYLRRLITTQTASTKTICEILEYFLRRLGSPSSASRRTAVMSLQSLFNEDPNGRECFLVWLPRLPQFESMRNFIITQLCNACQFETEPILLSAYVRFIVAHSLNVTFDKMLEHVMDMAQLIVERNTMLQEIAMGETLTGLFVMFNNYMIHLNALEDRTLLAVYPDLLTVRFAHGEHLHLHLNIVHAFIILQTYSNEGLVQSIPLVDYWFPPGGNPPVAHLPDMPESIVQIFPDWLRLEMLSSSVERLEDAALQDLTPEQIVLFIQNFGMPVSVVSKLLALLDEAVIQRTDEVHQAMLNRSYLAQLIQIEQARGAKNGHCTIQWLQLEADARAVPDLPSLQCRVLQTVELPQVAALETQPETSLDLLDAVRSQYELVPMPNAIEMFAVNNLDLLDFVGSETEQAEDHPDHNNMSLVSIRSSKQTLTAAVLKEFTGLLEQIANDIPICAPKDYSLRNIYTHLRAMLSYGLQVTELDVAALRNYLNGLDAKPEHALIYISIVKGLQNLAGVQQSLMSDKDMNAVLKRRIILELQKKFQCPVEAANAVGTYNTGIFLDYLVEFSPEIVHVVGKLEDKHLFTNTYSDMSIYLLSLINHHTNWHTIVSFVDNLFTNCAAQEYDYGAIFNFFEALLNNPKLWRGQVKQKQTRYNLLLNDNELETFVRMMLREAAADGCDRASARLNLYTRVSVAECHSLKKLADYILGVTSTDVSSALKSQVLMQLYAMFPAIEFIKPELKFTQGALERYKDCGSTKPTHALITCLGSLMTRRDAESLAHDTELLLRKLAATHPTLFLQQLGMLSSLIEDKAGNTLQSLREKQDLLRFTQILRILELLRPLIYDDNYRSDFEKIMTNVSNLLRTLRMPRENAQLIDHFLNLMKSYVDTRPAAGLSFAAPHAELIIACSSSNIQTEKEIGELVDAISVFQIDPSSNLEAESESVNYNNKTNRASLQLAPTTMDGLQFFTKYDDSITQTQLFHMCLENIESTYAHIRYNAYDLLIQHLESNPAIKDQNYLVLVAYMQCLNHDNSSVVQTAIEYLPQLTILLQEYATMLLETVFELGVKKRLEISQQMKKILDSLLIQLGI